MDSLSAVGAPPTLPSLDLSELPNEYLGSLVKYLSPSEAQSLAHAFPQRNRQLAQYAYEDFATREIGLGGTADERTQQTRALVSQLREWIVKGWVPEEFLKWKSPSRTRDRKIDVWATLKTLILRGVTSTRRLWLLNPAPELLSRENKQKSPNFSSPLWRYLLRKWLGRVADPCVPRYHDGILADQLLRLALKTEDQLLFLVVTTAFCGYTLDCDAMDRMVDLNWKILPPRSAWGYPKGTNHPFVSKYAYYYEPLDRTRLANLLNKALEKNAEETTFWLISCHIKVRDPLGNYFTGIEPIESNPFFVACRLGRTDACDMLWCRGATSHYSEVLTQGRQIAAEHNHHDIVAFLTRVLETCV